MESFSMGTKHEDANLILKLYELRRDDTMRKARSWFIGFTPQSIDDIKATMFGENSAYYRMVTSYWEMAATLVNHGAIDQQMFEEANGEHLVCFAKIEPFVAELRVMFNSPQAMGNLEKLVMSRPDAKEYLAGLRKRFEEIAALMRAAGAQAATTAA
jgi:hypothetical protein